jgi:hypothetical protein
MKNVAVTIATALALTFAFWLGQAQSAFGHRGQAQSVTQHLTRAGFQMTVEPSAHGAKFECQRGCSWKTLSFDCPESQPCKAVVDQTGVGTVGK